MRKTGRKAVIIKNSSVGLISQVLSSLFTFVTRSFFIKYIGVELLGLNSTFTSIISTLSLAELGFHSAIAYNLYKPLHENDNEAINDILNILKVAYRYIGVFFVAVSFIILPLLKYIITDFEVSTEIYIYFLLQAAASSCSYFLAYKRAILYADQKEYVSKITDTAFNTAISIIQCVALAIWGNYVVYLVLKIVQTFASNSIIHLYCSKHYTYLHTASMNKPLMKKVWVDVKNIFAAKIAGYIYGATDNIVISAFLSTISVGYLGNYSMIILGLKNLCSALLSPITPVIGNLLVEENADGDREKTFLLYSHVRYYIAAMVVAPTIVSINSFIAVWVGGNMILENSIVILLGIEFYIHIVHGSCTDFIFAGGLYRQEKNVEMAGALTNIVTSIVLVKFIGIQGVLIGTVISQTVFWVSRSLVVYRSCLKLSKSRYARYWAKNAVYAATSVFDVLASMYLVSIMGFDDGLVKFFIACAITEFISVATALIVFAKDDAQKQLLRVAKDTIGRRFYGHKR